MGVTSGLKWGEAVNAVLQTGKPQLSVYIFPSSKTHRGRGEVGSSCFWGDEYSSITRLTTSLETDPKPIKLLLLNHQWFEKLLDQALKPSSCNLACCPLCTWVILVPALCSEKVRAEQGARGCREHPLKWQRASFHLVSGLHNSWAQLCLQTYISFKALSSLQLDTWTTLSCRGTHGALEVLNQISGDGWRWKLLNFCSLVFMWRKWEHGSLTPWKWLEMKSTKEALMNILPLSHVVPSFPSPAADMQSQSLGF